MSWQALTALDEAGGHLESEVNEQGVTAVTSVVSLIDPEWVIQSEHRDRLAELLQNYVGLNATRLGGSPEDARRIRDIVLLDESRQILATARRGSSESEVQRRSLPKPLYDAYATQRGVFLTEFLVDGHAVRAFSHEIEHESESIGRVEVQLSAEQIQRSRAELGRAMRNVLIASCLVATLISFFLASFLTRPIRVLVKDMKHVSHGNLEHQSKVDSSDELGELARTFNSMTTNLHTAQQAKIAQKALEHELNVATRIQSRLLPSKDPELPGFDLASFYESAKEVGGDYYDFIQIDEQHWGLVVADVSGKGVPGSLVMTMTRSLLRLASRDCLSPAETLHEVNSCLSADMNPGMFVTTVYMIVDVRTREVRLSRAGHNAPVLYSRRHNKIVRIHPKGIAIGLDKQGSLFRSQLETQRLTLHTGDVLVLYSDGIVEAKNVDGEDWGDAKLDALVKANHDRSARAIVDAILDDVHRHSAGAEQSDDITLLVLRGR